QSTLEVRLESIKNIAGEEETLAVFNLRLVGKERLLNGTLTLLVDLDENFEGLLNIYSFKNGEWVQSYFKARSTPFDFYTNYVMKYFYPPNADTNFPYGGDNCLKKGEYYIKNMPISADKWPMVPFRGLTKIIIYFEYLKGKSIGGYEIVSNIRDKST
ncbi:hypothetical protein KR059_008133, partial [Drosophila kikkawai]